MTTNSQNINISSQNVKGYCDLKCSYDFKYPDSNSTATNNGIMISLTYENVSGNHVLYNQEKYNVSSINIYCPSIHYFKDGSQAPGEIVIHHTPIKGGNNLSVGIPFIESTEINSATNTITDIIETVAASAPSEGDSVNLNISDFTLQNVVPKKPYFTYKSNTDNTQWIVFGLFDAIPLNKTTLGTLSQLINPFNIATTGGDLFYNSKGPNLVGAGEGIYISCQPTGSSDEETTVSYTKDTTSYDIFNNKSTLLIIQIIIGCIIFIILFFILNYAYTYLISDEAHLKMNNFFRRNS